MFNSKRRLNSHFSLFINSLDDTQPSSTIVCLMKRIINYSKMDKTTEFIKTEGITTNLLSSQTSVCLFRDLLKNINSDYTISLLLLGISSEFDLSFLLFLLSSLLFLDLSFVSASLDEPVCTESR